jgi:hypothetical protein
MKKIDPGLALVVFFSVAVVLFLIDGGFSRPVFVGKGTVVDRSHTASSTGIGVGSSSNGGTTTVVTSNPEKWTVIVKLNGKIVSAEVESSLWASLKEGMRCDVYKNTGLLFRSNYGFQVF